MPQLTKIITCGCLFIYFTSLGQVPNGLKEHILELIAQCDDQVYDNPVQSLAMATEANRLARELKDDSLIAVTLNRVGSAHWSLGNGIEALEKIQESLQIAETRDYEQIMARNYGNIGNVYSAVGLDLDAISYYRLELSILEKQNTPFRLFAINNNIGKAFLDIDFYDSAHFYLGKASTFLDSTFIHLHSFFYFNLAETYFREEKLSNADSLLQLTLLSATKYESKRGIIRANQLQAELDRKVGNYEKALDHALLATKMANESHAKELIYICHKTLSNCYADLNDFEKAYKHQKIHEAYLDSVQNVATVSELELLSYYQRIFQLRVLEERNVLSQQLAKQRQLVIYGLIGVIIAAVLMISMIIRRGRKINRQAKKLEELNAFKTKIFAIISHDLKSPLLSVLSTIEMFQDRLMSKQEISTHLPEIQSKTSGLLDLLNNIFNWAEGQMENLESPKEWCSLLDILNDIERELKDRLKEKQIELEYDKNMSVRLYANTGIVRIVLRNLLVNAIKFSHPNTKVTVRSFEQDDHKVIEVSDQGIGMSSQKLEGIFSLESGSTDGTNGEQGNGLGLALCCDFVRNMGGEIEVESKEGIGSTFRIVLTDPPDQQ